MQVLFNYGPNYIATYCSAVGTAYLAQSTTAPGFSAPSNNPPQPVSPSLLHPYGSGHSEARLVWDRTRLFSHRTRAYGHSVRQRGSLTPLKRNMVMPMAACLRLQEGHVHVLTGLCDLQPQGTPRGTVSSSCNSDLPSQATYQRFLFVVRHRPVLDLASHQRSPESATLHWTVKYLKRVLPNPVCFRQVMLAQPADD